MKKIRNPYQRDKNLCFGCGQNNPVGLKLVFEEDEEYLCTQWHPTEFYQGYLNILHGGIAATLLDEAGAWCVSVKIGTACVTSDMKIKYLRPVYITKGDINIKARIIEQTTKSAKLLCQLYDGDSKVCVEAESIYFLYPEEIAKKRYNYPGRDAFYNEE
jgi:uncharacterized protein (TIGR00369 family)